MGHAIEGEEKVVMSVQQRKELFERTAKVMELIVADDLLEELASSVLRPEFSTRLRMLRIEAKGVLAIAQACR